MSKENTIKNLLIHGAGQLLNMLTPFLVGFYVIPICGIEKWGIVGVITSLFILIGLLVEFGANLVGVKELSAHHFKQNYVKSYISLNYKFRLVSCVIITIVMVVVFSVLKVNVAYYFGISWMFAWYYNPLWIFQAKEDFKTINKIIVYSKILYVVLVFIMIRDSEHYVYVVGLLGFCNAVVYCWYYYKIPKRSINLKKVAVFVKVNKSIVVSNFAINCYTQAPVFIIDFFLGNAATGIYKIIDLFLVAFRSYLGVFFNVTYPRFCSLMLSSVNKARVYVYKMLLGNIIFLVVSLIVIMFLLPYLLSYFNFSNNVNSSIKYGIYLLLLPIIVALNIPFYQVLLFKNKNKIIVSTSFIGLVLTILCGVLFTNFYGFLGICFTIYIVEIFITTALFYNGKKYLSKS